jgi:hypothetical protein
MRFILGLFLVLVAFMAALVAIQSFAEGYSPRAAGQLTGSLFLSLTFGFVGFRMMQRRTQRQ